MGRMKELYLTLQEQGQEEPYTKEAPIVGESRTLPCYLCLSPGTHYKRIFGEWEIVCGTHRVGS